MLSDDLELIPLAMGLPLHRFREAYDRVLPLARTLQPADFCQVNVDIPQAAITARAALPGLRLLRPQAAQLPFIDLELYDAVEIYALALTQAHTFYRAISRPPEAAAVLTKQLKRVRLELLADVRAMINRALLEPSLLESLQGANGSKNAAMDVLVVCAALRNAWPKISGKTAVTLAELDAAEQLADQLHGALGRRLRTAQLVSEAADTRRRVYALFFRAYDEARRVVLFLRWHEGDAEQIAPSLYAGRRSKSGKGSVEETVFEQAADSVDASDAAPSPVDT